MSITRLLSICHGFEFHGIKLNVLAIADLIALDDVGGLDLLPALGIDLAVFDPMPGFLVDLMEADPLALRRGGKKSDRAGNEGELEIALPVGTGRHNYELLTQMNSQDSLRAAPSAKS